MRTIRRVYFYIIAFISVETLVWGITNLLRSITHQNFAGDQTNILSSGLAQIIVSIPILLFHWLTVQKDANNSEEEKSSVIRAIFLYGVLLSTLIPVVQNFMALLNRLLNQGSRIELGRALIGGNQTAGDNLIAIVVNLIMAVYFFRILRNDWLTNPDHTNLTNLQRLYRYLWTIYSLSLTVIGVQMVVKFILSQSATIGFSDIGQFTNAVTVLSAGVPLWFFWWSKIQSSIIVVSERQSILRIVVMYLITLGSAVVFAVFTGIILFWLLRPILGEFYYFSVLMRELQLPISMAVPFGVLWWYYGSIFNKDIKAEVDDFRRAALRRLYRYILSFAGLSAVVYGIAGLAAYIINLLGQFDMTWTDTHQTLAINLAVLIVGATLWLSHWLPVNKESYKINDTAGFARRSLSRKIYLYLVVFLMVVGTMASAGYMIYIILQGLFGNKSDHLLIDSVQNLRLVIIFAAFLGYHIQCLRRDNKNQQHDLLDKYASFSISALVEPDSSLGLQLKIAFERHAAGIALTFIRSGEKVENWQNAKVLILESSSILDGGDKFTQVVKRFTGKILVIPSENDQLIWINSSGKEVENAKACAVAARAFADGQTINQLPATKPWMVVLYIIAGLMALQFLGVLISLLSV
jgi:hypothetical protein